MIVEAKNRLINGLRGISYLEARQAISRKTKRGCCFNLWRMSAHPGQNVGRRVDVRNDRFWRKADIGMTWAEGLLLTQSGHSSLVSPIAAFDPKADIPVTCREIPSPRRFL